MLRPFECSHPTLGFSSPHNCRSLRVHRNFPSVPQHEQSTTCQLSHIVSTPGSFLNLKAVALQVRSLGRQQFGGLFTLGDELINLQPLHSLLAVSVSEMLPVNIAVLFSADAKRLARSGSLGQPGGRGMGPAPSYESLMTSPWKVRNLLAPCKLEDDSTKNLPALEHKRTNAGWRHRAVQRRITDPCMGSKRFKACERSLASVLASSPFLARLELRRKQGQPQPRRQEVDHRIPLQSIG